MGIFNPFVSMCEHERNLDWILQRVKNMPQRDEMLSALEEARKIDSRTKHLVEQVESVIGNATEAAKAEIKRELEDLLSRVESADGNISANVETINNIIDDAVGTAKTRIEESLSNTLNEMRSIANDVSSKRAEIESVISGAIGNLGEQFDAATESAIADLVEQNYSLGEELNAEAVRQIDSVVDKLIQDNNETFDEVWEYVDECVANETGFLTATYIPKEVRSVILGNMRTCGIYIPVSAWNSSNLARAECPIDIEGFSTFVTYSPGSFNDWYDNGVRCVGASGRYLDFECANIPENELYIYVLAVGNVTGGWEDD